MTRHTLHLGDCLDVMRTMPDCSVDAVVTDPPYGLSFMGKAWDYDVPGVDVWREALRVLKPGGHLLAFAGTRTQHRMAVAIEDAGFEIRDMIAWVYGSGFPKSLNVSKAIDKAAGAEREAPATPEAQQWAGWGTALKPALEPVTMARKPFKGTVAANVMEHGTGAINVDGCRVDGGDAEVLAKNWDRHQSGSTTGTVQYVAQKAIDLRGYAPSGRWPANLIHDGSDEVVGLFGEAQRFFYCSKASKADRDDGNTHPTVKPTDLMRYFCRLVTPPGGIVLDPFMGSGSTGKAAVPDGFHFIGIERDPSYFAVAEHRINNAQPELVQQGLGGERGLEEDHV